MSTVTIFRASGMVHSSIGIFLELLVWHLISDVMLQSKAMAAGKRRESTAGIIILATHGFIHGFGAGLILTSFWVMLWETIAHACVDFGKCRRYYGLVVDQCAHLIGLVCWSTLMIGV